MDASMVAQEAMAEAVVWALYKIVRYVPRLWPSKGGGNGDGNCALDQGSRRIAPRWLPLVG